MFLWDGSVREDVSQEALDVYDSMSIVVYLLGANIETFCRVLSFDKV